jgi:hypothetical protein
MNRETETLETLDRKLAELASFLSPSEIFRALLEGSVAGVPRAAIFLLRDGRWKGWSSIGYPTAVAVDQRQAVAPSESGWLAALASEEDVRWRSLTSGESVPDFGQSGYSEAVGFPVRVGGKAIAIVVAERAAGESPWSPAAVAILCQAARLRLELDLAWRRLKGIGGQTQAPSAGIEPVAPASAPAPALAPMAANARTPVDVMKEEPRAAAAAAVADAPAAATGIAPWSGVAAGKADADPRREEARRYARLVATDIRLYNEEAVVVGRRQRDLASRLKEHIQRGREAFSRRFPDLGADGVKILDDAYVQVLAGGDASLLS